MFKTSGRASFLIILFQFLQYYVFVVLSGDVFVLFHWHFYCDSFTREEDCIQNLLCTQRTFGNYWAFAMFSGPDLIVCVEVLRPSQPSGVMSSAVSLPNHTFTGQD